eukprot:7240813-Heterocapsa_arctica.AAC.1
MEYESIDGDTSKRPMTRASLICEGNKWNLYLEIDVFQGKNRRLPWERFCPLASYSYLLRCDA